MGHDSMRMAIVAAAAVFFAGLLTGCGVPARGSRLSMFEYFSRTQPFVWRGETGEDAMNPVRSQRTIAPGTNEYAVVWAILDSEPAVVTARPSPNFFYLPGEVLQLQDVPNEPGPRFGVLEQGESRLALERYGAVALRNPRYRRAIPVRWEGGNRLRRYLIDLATTPMSGGETRP